jgi:hypothetical protein
LMPERSLTAEERLDPSISERTPDHSVRDFTEKEWVKSSSMPE